MPNIQVAKKRLPKNIFRALIISQMKAIENGIHVVSPALFAHSLIECSHFTIKKYFDSVKESGLLNDLFAMCEKTKDKIDFNSLKIHQTVCELVGKSYNDIDKFGVENFIYLLIKDNSDLLSVAKKNGITLDELSEMVSRENKLSEKFRNESLENHDRFTRDKKFRNSEIKENAIDEFCVDFTKKAKNGELSPVFCRQDEMDQIITTLLKKNKANPLLIGEPGVGKTVIVEGIAQKICHDDVPDRLKNHRIISMSLSSAIQGTTLRGQFEERLYQILKETIDSKNVILFIDEIHTLIGAGSGSESSLDAGNIMKPYLARGDLRCIGATTFDDYYKHMRKDKALSRRFQRIFISEPDENKTISIINGLIPSLESFHNCIIEESIVEYLVKLCKRFLTDRFFPDKAIDCLDHACAKASLYSNIVSKEIIEQVISEFSDVPISLIRKNDFERMDGIEDFICSEVVGNVKSIKELCNRIRFCLSTKKSLKSVLSSIVLYGPSGVGKKTLVHKLADSLYGSGAVITINGAEFSEQNSNNKIIGSPPGYIGHDNEAFILREVRRRPYSIILIKNIDQMHSSVSELFRQVITTGNLTDVHGMITDFSNCIIMIAVDVAKINSNQIGFSKSNNTNEYYSEFKKILSRNSILKSVNHIIGFEEVTRDDLLKIVAIEMNKIENDLRNSGIIIRYCEEVFSLFSAIHGSPSEIRSKVRDCLELAMSEKIRNGPGKYVFCVDNNQIKVMEDITIESCSVQS